MIIAACSARALKQGMWSFPCNSPILPTEDTATTQVSDNTCRVVLPAPANEFDTCRKPLQRPVTGISGK